MKNIMMDISNTALRLLNGKIYYFDTNGIYTSIPLSEALEMNISNINITKYKSRSYFDPYSFFNIAFKPKNLCLIKKAITMLKEGDSLETLDEYLSIVKLDKRPKPEGIDRFILSIDKPIFGRDPENPNPKTFDYIRIIMNIVTEWEQDRKKYIENHIDDFNKMIINKLEKNRSFQKFDIPINFLHASKITFSARNNLVEYIFEIKEISS